MKNFRKISGAVVGGALLAALGVSYAVYRMSPRVTHQVELSAYHQGARISLAKIDEFVSPAAGEALDENWKEYAPGKHELADGVYLFETKLAQVQHRGMIAVKKSGPIVLK